MKQYLDDLKPINLGLNALLGEMVKLAHNVDGVISVSSEAIEGPTIAACNDYKKIYTVGVQVAPRVWDERLHVEDIEVEAFLGKQEKKSVLYISFGFGNHPKNFLSQLTFDQLHVLPCPRPPTGTSSCRSSGRDRIPIPALLRWSYGS